MNRLCVSAPIGLLAAALALSGCNPPPLSGQAQADAQTRAACEQRAEQVYEQRNRGEIYSAPSQVNTPYSANYVPGMTDRGLSEQFSHDRMVSNCIRNTGTGAMTPSAGAGQTPAAPSAAQRPARARSAQ